MREKGNEGKKKWWGREVNEEEIKREKGKGIEGSVIEGREGGRLERRGEEGKKRRGDRD